MLAGLFTLLLIAAGVGLFLRYWIDPSPPPPIRVIHVTNRLWIPQESFAIDVRQTEPELTDAQVDERYATFLDDLEELQQEQAFKLRELVQAHGLRSVFYEGVTDDNREMFESANSRIKVTEKLQIKMHEAGNSEEAMRIRQNLNRIYVESRDDRLQLGAVGAVLRDGTIESVLPLESTEVEDGQIPFAPAADQAREAEMARRIVVVGPVAIVILAGKYDLTDALKATGQPFTYERVETPTYSKLAK